jgi:hypothetical protein
MITTTGMATIRPTIYLAGRQIYADVVYGHPGIILIAMKAEQGDREAAAIAQAIQLRIAGINDSLWFDYERDIPQ